MSAVTVLYAVTPEGSLGCWIHGRKPVFRLHVEVGRVG